MRISEFQKLIKDIYFDKDKERGVDKTFVWFMEEVGELAEEVRKQESTERLQEEFVDVLAWLFSLANLKNIEIEEALMKKYPGKCPKCKNIPCLCS